jgi:hypothetical protein
LAITRLSPAGGQAGDPVSIVGSGFGEAGGTVHFVFGATDYGAIVNAWHDTQIDTYLPPVSGSATLTTPNRVGYFYVVRNPDQARSPMAGFLVVNPLL